MPPPTPTPVNQGHRKTQPIQFVLMALIIITLGLWLFGPSKQSKQPQIPDNLPALAAALKDHYRQYPIGGGWTVLNAEFSAKAVSIRILVPREQASRMMNNPTAMQIKAARGMCPNKYDGFYDQLRGDQYIETSLGFYADDKYVIWVEAPCEKG